MELAQHLNTALTVALKDEWDERIPDLDGCSLKLVDRT